jgi:hypothetical protein
MTTKAEQRTATEVKGKEVTGFMELMKEVAGLPEAQQEKVCIFVQGFMAAGIRPRQESRA